MQKKIEKKYFLKVTCLWLYLGLQLGRTVPSRNPKHRGYVLPFNLKLRQNFRMFSGDIHNGFTSSSTSSFTAKMCSTMALNIRLRALIPRGKNCIRSASLLRHQKILLASKKEIVSKVS